MAPPKKPMPHFEVDDPAEAYRKAQDFTRRILAVPKTEIDARLAKEVGKHKTRKR